MNKCEREVGKTAYAKGEHAFPGPRLSTLVWDGAKCLCGKWRWDGKREKYIKVKK